VEKVLKVSHELRLKKKKHREVPLKKNIIKLIQKRLRIFAKEQQSFGKIQNIEKK
jgi:hypothetical protein